MKHHFKQISDFWNNKLEQRLEPVLAIYNSSNWWHRIKTWWSNHINCESTKAVRNSLISTNPRFPSLQLETLINSPFLLQSSFSAAHNGRMRNYLDFCFWPSEKRKEKNYQEKKNPLNYKTSWKINAFFLSHIFFSPFFVRFLINELKNCFIFFALNYSSQHNSVLVGEQKKKSERYLNFYTQLIWEWLFKRDVYIGIARGSENTPLCRKFSLPFSSSFQSSLFIILSDNEFMGGWIKMRLWISIYHGRISEF